MTTRTANIAESLRAATARLAEFSETPRLDAEILMAHAVGCSRADMLIRQHDLAVPATFAALIERRAASEPIAYIRGRQEFWDLDLEVSPDVLIPRGDSETLIELAVETFDRRSAPERILDLGTGSGALLLAALSAFPSAHGIGVDASQAALAVAVANAERLGFGDRVMFRQRDWNIANWKGSLGPFDLILCNPPYVEVDAELDATVQQYEPHRALYSGADGLNDYSVLIPQIPELLASNAVAIFEIGHTQAQAVTNLAIEAGLSSEMRRDLAGNPRALRFSLGIEQTRR